MKRNIDKICQYTVFPGAFMAIVLSSHAGVRTIIGSPSWSDEAIFANISWNLASTGKYTLNILPGHVDGEVFLYGPIFFLLQSHFINAFGLDDLVFRLNAFVSGYLAIFLLGGALKNLGLRWWAVALFLLFATLDISFNRSISNGRMDMMALMFVCAGLFLSTYPIPDGWKWRCAQWMLVGFFSAAAYLTTPRALFLLPVVLLTGVDQVLVRERVRDRRQKLFLVTLSTVCFLAPILLWIQYTGGFENYVRLFAENKGVTSHIAPSFFRSYFDNIGITIFIILSIINYRRISRDFFLIGLIATYIAFSFFVREVGPYAGMIMPFLLAGVTVLLLQPGLFRLARVGVICALVMPGLAAVSLRTIELRWNNACHDPSEVVATLNEMSFENIAAPFKYYFHAQTSGTQVVKVNWKDADREKTAGILAGAAVVIADERHAADLRAMGFAEVARFDCNLREVPFLPRSAYQEQIYKESVFRRIAHQVETP